jgi:hypothetical protein
LSEHLGLEVRVTTSTGEHAGRLTEIDLGSGLTLVGEDGTARSIAGRDATAIVNLAPRG